MFTKAHIPYRAYYSSPFSKWQMTLANSHSLELAAQTTSRWLATKGIDPLEFDYLYLGYTIHQRQAFYGAPWVAGMVGALNTPACAVTQACSTSTTCLYNAAAGLEAGTFSHVLAVTADRCSNGPHAVWPNPQGPGGEVVHENWLMDNFARDPHAGGAMVQTAENVAGEVGLTKERCDEATARRYEQYGDALKDDRKFQKGYMFPVEVAVSRKKTVTLEQDEGLVLPTTLETLSKLKPATPGGVHIPAHGHEIEKLQDQRIIAIFRDSAEAAIEFLKEGLTFVMTPEDLKDYQWRGVEHILDHRTRWCGWTWGWARRTGRDGIPGTRGPAGVAGDAGHLDQADHPTGLAPGSQEVVSHPGPCSSR